MFGRPGRGDRAGDLRKRLANLVHQLDTAGAGDLLEQRAPAGRPHFLPLRERLGEARPDQEAELSVQRRLAEGVDQVVGQHWLEPVLR